MRIMIYNIAYGTGNPGAEIRRVLTSHRYLRSGNRDLNRIADFVKSNEVDILGLVEADLGSFRTAGVDQVAKLARRLKMSAASATKYSVTSLVNRIPIIRSQANALLSAHPGQVRTHYLPAGFKKMVLEVDFQEVSIVLVHLALSRRVRQLQLGFLSELLADRERLIIGGDFNTFAGEKEIARLKRRLHLYNPNTERQGTYPAWNPLKQLDYLLFSESIEVTNFQVPDFMASDHLPIIADFQLKES